MTSEDNIHEHYHDNNFRNGLRLLNSPKEKSHSVLQKSKGEDKEAVLVNSTVCNPPQFYQADMDKWMNDKFSLSIKERKADKTKILSLGCFIPFGTTNINAANRTKLKRKGSLSSLQTLTNVDFNYSGNSNEI